MSRYTIFLIVFGLLFLAPYFPGIVGVHSGRELLLYWLGIAAFVILFGVLLTKFKWEDEEPGGHEQ